MPMEGYCVFQGQGGGGAHTIIQVKAGIPYRIHNRGVVPITFNTNLQVFGVHSTSRQMRMV